MEKQNLLDILFANNCNTLTESQKYELKLNRPTPHLKLEHNEGNFSRKFQFSWYSKYHWLTGCDQRDKMYCFVCLMFGGEKQWTVDGISLIKNFIRQAEKHSISRKHLMNEEKFHLLGKLRFQHVSDESQRLAILKHNELVGTNRRLLARMIHIVCFLGKQGLPFCDHHYDEFLNNGNFVELLKLLAQGERLVNENIFLSPTINQRTSRTIQKDLIECVTSVLNSVIFEEIQAAKYVSIQADESSDVSCRSQISIILRYVIKQNIVERFVGFVNVPRNKTPSDLADVFFTEINKWEITSKLVYHTYDGALFMPGEKTGIQCIFKELYPNALFINCHSHHLNLVLLHGAKVIKSVKFFICDLSMFHSFFSEFTNRSAQLRKQGFKLPIQSDNGWNYHSKASFTIKTHYKELKNAVIYVIENPSWDPISVCTASKILEKLNDANFVYLLIFFSKIFEYTDYVFNIPQSKMFTNIKVFISEIQNLKQNLADLRKELTVDDNCNEAILLNNDLEYGDKKKNDLCEITFKTLDSLINQIETRFEDLPKFEFVELTDEKMFRKYNKTFPESKFVMLLQQYPNIFDENRLRNELSVIYSDSNKQQPPNKLLDYIVKSK